MALTATQPRLGRLERAALQGVIVREVVNYSSFWRSSTFSSTVDPTIYLLAFGFGFGSLVSTVAGYDYIDFVGTGIVATTVLFSGAFPAMYSTFVKYEFQHTYDAILAAPVDTEELVTAEGLWIAARTGTYGCVPMLVAMAFGLEPSWGMLLVPFIAGARRHRVGVLRHLHRGEVEGDRELLVLAERPADADVPRRGHVLPARRAADDGPRSPATSTRCTTASSSSAHAVFGFEGWVDVWHLVVPRRVRARVVAARDQVHGAEADPVTTNRRWLLSERPSGIVSREHFEWVEEPVPEIGDGEFLVRNLWISCDPAQRAWMEIDTYIPKLPLGEVMAAGTVGEVVESKHPDFVAGDLVSGVYGWQDYAVGTSEGFAAACSRRSSSRRAPTPRSPCRSFGITGLTAYFGLLDVGELKEGDAVLVSGAAGAVGSIACQIAKVKGCRVVGIAGGDAEVRLAARASSAWTTRSTTRTRTSGHGCASCSRRAWTSTSTTSAGRSSMPSWPTSPSTRGSRSAARCPATAAWTSGTGCATPTTSSCGGARCAASSSSTS